MALEAASPVFLDLAEAEAPAWAVCPLSRVVDLAVDLEVSLALVAEAVEVAFLGFPVSGVSARGSLRAASVTFLVEAAVPENLLALAAAWATCSAVCRVAALVRASRTL